MVIHVLVIVFHCLPISQTFLKPLLWHLTTPGSREPNDCEDALRDCHKTCTPSPWKRQANKNPYLIIFVYTRRGVTISRTWKHIHHQQLRIRMSHYRDLFHLDKRIHSIHVYLFLDIFSKTKKHPDRRGKQGWCYDRVQTKHPSVS